VLPELSELETARAHRSDAGFDAELHKRSCEIKRIIPDTPDTICSHQNAPRVVAITAGQATRPVRVRFVQDAFTRLMLLFHSTTVSCCQSAFCQLPHGG
jgi:hypothetical protein